MLVVAMGMMQCTIKDNWMVLGKLSKTVCIKGGNLIRINPKHQSEYYATNCTYWDLCGQYRVEKSEGGSL